MNIKNILKNGMFLWTALVMAWIAEAGDIRSIFPVSTDTHTVTSSGGNLVYGSDNYVAAGQKARFCVRLLNKDSSEGVQSARWSLVYTGLWSEDVAAALNPPAMGIMVGGRLRFAKADFSGGEANGITIDAEFPSHHDAAYSDLLFSYTVQSGDLALPLHLANSAGKEASNSDTTQYYLSLGDWAIQCVADGATNSVDMAFGASGDYGDNPTAQRDYDLSLAQIYLKTVDFDSYPTDSGYADSDVWRKVRSNSTEVLPYAASLILPSGSSTNESSTVYLWTTNNEHGAYLANGSEKDYTLPDGTVAHVYAATFAPNTTEITFKIRGGDTEDAEVDLFMSSTPTNIYNGSGDLIPNFLTRKIKVVAPPQPSVSVTLGSAQADNLDITCTTNYYASVTRMTVTLSDRYTSDVTVNLNPTLDGVADVFKDRVIAISESASGNWKDSIVSNVTFKTTDDSLTKILYIYALGATTNSASYEHGVNFKPTLEPAAANDFYTGGIKGAQLRVHGIDPVVLSPAEGGSLSFVGGQTKNVQVQITDSYRDYTGVAAEGYTIVWDRGGGLNSEITFTNQIPVNGVFTLPIKYTTAKTYDSAITITNPEGGQTVVSFKAVVSEPARVYLTTVTGETTFNESDTDGVAVKVQLSEAYSDALYAFIVPANGDAITNCTSKLFATDVNGAASSKCYIKLTSADAVTPAEKIYLNDGRPCFPEFQVVLCTTENYDTNNIVSVYQSDTLYLTVNNKAPTVTGVNVGGKLVAPNGTTPKTPMGIPKKFEAKIDDVTADLSITNDTATCHVVKWSITDGQDVYPQTFYTFGSNTLWYAFENEGTNSVEVCVMDKDMRTSGDLTWHVDADAEGGGYWEEKDGLTWGSPSTIYVNVSETPYVIVEPAWGTDTIDEDSKSAKFNISLSTAPSKRVNIVVGVYTNGAPYTDITLSSKDVSVLANKNPVNVVTLSNLDGTANTDEIEFRAVVTNLTTDTATGSTMSNLYVQGSYTFGIANVDPVIKMPADGGTNAVTKTLNTPFDLKWQISDVVKDLRDGMTVSFISDDAGCDPLEKTSTNGVVGTSVETGTYTAKFTTAGAHTITMTVTDKDGGMATREWYYYVNPSKHLYLTPHHPAKSSITTLVRKYGSDQPGVGVGYTEVTKDGSLSETDADWTQQWDFSVTATTANFWGRGLKAGETYTDGKSKVTTGDSVYDSFFYAWLTSTADENGGTYTTSVLSIDPGVGFEETNAKKKGSVALPEQDSDKESYADTRVDAIFAKELYVEDNVGDINQDGIPDIFATKEWSGGTLYSDSSDDSSSSSSGSDSSTEATGADLTNVAAANDDGDYLPAKAVSASTLVPHVESSWTTAGRPFRALLEVRGFHEGLNYRESGSGLNYNVSGNWISVPCFSEAESNAFAKVAGLKMAPEDAEAKPEQDEGESDEDYATRVTEWETAEAKKITDWKTSWSDALASTSWSPENRTDPTMEDTDSDGFPDGYEYYFWYAATVGEINAEGKWVQMTGARYCITNLAEATLAETKISSKEIATAFNPTVSAGLDQIVDRDTDGDGLTDWEEFVIGTNPITWDTDGDGLPDSWEVLNGLDPTKKDADANADGDFMASVKFPETANTDADYWAIITVAGTNYAVQANGAGVVEVQLDGSAKLVEGVTNFNGIAVFSYGLGSSDYIPIATKRPEANQVLSNAELIEGFYLVDRKGDWVWTAVALPEDTAEVKIELKKTLRLIHEQVYSKYGFDPRTGWFVNSDGLVAARWKTTNKAALYLGDTGVAQNTAKYTALDEYLLLRYRYMTRPLHVKVNPSDDTDKTYDVTRDWDKIVSGGETVHYVFSLGTTLANIANEVTYGEVSQTEDGETTSYTIAYTNVIHGADTDSNGVPDGWELYVGHNPNSDASSDESDSDGDKLALAAEYAGTDSCDAYTNAFSTISGQQVATIGKNHPGTVSGWYNKFFPTDPNNGDTDGDHIGDGDEGGSWVSSVVYGKSSASSGSTHTYTFIYGNADGKPVDDSGTLVAESSGYATTTCFRGGGLNPCSVDTDYDLLPDPWEREFAGIVITTEGKSMTSDVTDEKLALMCRSDGIENGGAISAYYITGGMDGTFGWDTAKNTWGDAFTFSIDSRTGTLRDMDFDHDGLQNFQEYMVQSLRHLRYDDCLTPLMGSWMPSGLASSRKFVGFLPMDIMDGEAFYATAKSAGYNATGAWAFDTLGYFARAPHEWDPTALNTYTQGKMKYDDLGFRVMLPPTTILGDGSEYTAGGYASTDPRQWDTDGDAMDDYYEIFHGLNPLLGSVAGASIVNDVIAQKYNLHLAWYYNAWMGWPMLPPEQPSFDAMKYPWLNGTPECDADGDGLRNADEALLVNMTTAQNYHTDPTPLWYTDATIKNKASYTAQYYAMQDDLIYYPWGWIVTVNGGLSSDGSNQDYLFAFEENEGYDTDHDGLPDGDEQVTSATFATDALNFADPDRRQALWFPGENSAAITRWSTQNRPNYLAYDFLRQFTVEAWICPTDPSRDQVVLERACLYGSSSISNVDAIVCANFRVGIKNGKVYGEFENSTKSATATVEGGEVSSNAWSHVALTFNGATLSIYQNGMMVASVSSSQIPANGIQITGQEAQPNRDLMLINGYTANESAFALGARVKDKAGLDLNANTSWEDYGDFYAGWVDEVRVWDGAQSGSAIYANYKTRMSVDEVKALRDDVFDSWSAGATRNDNDGKTTLPVELVLHYNFQTLPSAVTGDLGDILYEPFGFTKNVVDAVRVEGAGVPGDLYCGWWNETPVHSTVYVNTRWVPWIVETCGHLPMIDGSTLDSHYWSESLGGMTFASEQGYESYAFPNTMNPYPYSSFLSDHAWRLMKLYLLSASNMTVNLQLLATNLFNRYEFQLTRSFVGSSDLVPLGGAFAKRCENYWDCGLPSDYWTASGFDDNADGIPDWWVAYAAKNYGLDTSKALSWLQTYCDYFGEQVTLREAYLHDLDRGLVADSTSADGAKIWTAADGTANSTESVDANGNGVWDSWERLYGELADLELDADNDALSGYDEYLVYRDNALGKANGVRVALDPNNQRTDSHVLDYYRSFSKNGELTYVGAQYTDHDFMEDWWERDYNETASSDYAYDPLDDADEDGWNNWSECRWSLWSSFYRNDAIDRWMTEEMRLNWYPQPAVAVRLTYHGIHDLNSTEGTDNGENSESASTLKSIVVRTKAAGSTRMDAQFVIPYSDEGATTVNEKFVCFYHDDATAHGFMSPGQVTPLSVTFEVGFLNSDRVYYWNWSWYLSPSNTMNDASSDSEGGSAFWGRMPTSGDYATYTRYHQQYPHIVLESADVEWNPFGTVSITAGKRYGKLVYTETQKQIGTIDLDSGEYALSLADLKTQLDNHPVTDTTVDYDSAVIRVTYISKIGYEWPQTLYLSDPHETIENSLEYDSGISENSYHVFDHVRSGLNTIEAFVDLDNDSQWDPGEPLGTVKNVRIGWQKTDPIVIELKDTSTIVPRINLATMTDDRTVLDGSASDVSYAAASSSGDSGASSTGLRTTVKIVRTAINGNTTDYPSRVVGTHTYITSDRNYLMESDFTSAKACWDLDAKLAADTADGQDSVSRVTYQVMRKLSDGVYTNIATFVNTYNSERGVAVGVEPIEGGIVYAASPTLTWSTDDETMTAFRLQVSTTESTDGLVYDSGIQPMPGRLGTTVAKAGYSFTPPIYRNAQVETNGAPVFAAGTNYYWRVLLMNAKFVDSDEEKDWSPNAWNKFHLSAKDSIGETGYGDVSVAVRYYDAARLTTTESIVVEAYRSGDFSGQPLSQVHLAADVDRGAMTNMTYRSLATDMTVTLTGIPEGTVYVRAYIDQNNNGRRDPWESWGYSNYLGEDTDMPFNVKPIELTAADLSPRTCHVIIEDGDLNGNGLPDCQEVKTSADESKFDNWAEVSDEDESDTWEEWSGGVDSVVADTDVMAYAEKSVVYVKIGATEDSASWYAITDLSKETVKLHDGLVPLQTPASELKTLVTTWSLTTPDLDIVNPYDGTMFGLGTNIVFDAADTLNRVFEVRAGTACLFHAQVYAEFGFNSLTANGRAYVAGTAVNTKKFTAADKYLVCRYLENIGVEGVSEETLKETLEWSTWTLDPATDDSDNDGIADGWELYVMFGGAGTTSAGLAISPFNTSDGLALAPGVGSALTLAQEYDNGYWPTDPWSLDSDNDGISDANAYAYGLKGNGYRGDEDNDQLSNWAEFLAAVGFQSHGLPAVKSDNAFSLGQVVPDYYLPYGGLYLGEMFGDHDLMEDTYEDDETVRTATGEDFSRGTYDAWTDGEAVADGWSKWSELRSYAMQGMRRVSQGYVSNIVSKTFTVGESSEAAAFKAAREADGTFIDERSYNVSAGSLEALNKMNGSTVTYYEVIEQFADEPIFQNHPIPTVRVQLHYNGEYSISNITVKAWHGRDASGTPDAVWNDRTVGSDGLLVLGAADSGWLREGANLFVVEAVTASASSSADATKTSESTSWTPGMPYGVALDVMVGYASAKFDLEVTETTPITARMNISSTYGAGSQSEAVASTDRAQQDTASGFGNTILSKYAGTNGISATKNVRMRVVRNWVNGSANATVTPSTIGNVVLDRVLDLNVHPYLTEADLYADGTFDLDWGKLDDETINSRHYDVTNVTYRIVLGNDAVGDFDNFANNVAFMFSNVFERNDRTPAQPKSPIYYTVVKTGTPTFTWTHQNTINKPYPAFRLRVFKSVNDRINRGEDPLVYDSGIRQAPMRDQDGVYHWTPPDLHVGEAMLDGIIFENDTKYWWTVDMLDAKFTSTTDPGDAPWGYFTMNVDSTGGASSDLGLINVAVKYFGSVPASTNIASLAKLIRVEAFTTPDFAGAPVAVTYVKSTAELANPSNTALNAVLLGVPASTSLYVRAYIDSNGVRTNAFYQTWGYANYVGTDRTDVYTPRAFTVAEGSVQMPTAVIYLDDVDMNNNGLPDALEWNANDGLRNDQSPSASPYVVTSISGTEKTLTTTNTFAWLDAATVSLPYVSAIRQMENGGTLSVLELMMATCGVVGEIQSDPIVTITSFSLDKGVELAVDTRTTINGDTLEVPANNVVKVNIKLNLYATDDLSAWPTVPTATTPTTEVSVNAENGTVDAADMVTINAAIKAKIAELGSSAFFKVTAEVVIEP